MKWSSYRRALIIGLAAGSLAVAGCGSSGGDASSAGVGAAGASGASGAIKVGLFSNNVGYTTLWVALDKGFFKKNGLNIKITNLEGGGSAAVPAIVSGSVSLAVGGAADVITAISKGVLDAKFFYETQSAGYDVVVKKGITSFDQLKGKTVGVSGEGGADQAFLQATLADQGLAASDVTFVRAGTVSARLSALDAGKVDAIANVASGRSSELAVGSVLLKAEDNLGEQPPTGVGIATSTFISSSPRVVSSFVKAMNQATAWVRDDRNEQAAIDVCVKDVDLTEAACKEGIDYNKSTPDKSTWSADGKISESALQTAVKQATAFDPKAGSLEVTDLVVPGYSSN